jgi:maltose O-acetyltransferase
VIRKGVRAVLNSIRYRNVSYRSIVLGNVNLAPSASISAECFIKADKRSSIDIEANVEIKDGCRLFALNGNEIRIREGAIIKNNTVIMPREEEHSGSVDIGEGSIIHRDNSLDITGDIRIGPDVRTGENTYFHTHSHPIGDVERIWDNEPDLGEIVVGEGCWIGTMCQLMPEAELPAHSVLAAGGILTKKYKNRGLFAGVPAERIKGL